MDLYQNYQNLLKENEIVKDFIIEYNIVPDNNVLIFTPHGGKIEKYTTELVKAIASDDMSWYSFTGKKRNNNKLLHITSTNFDEPICLIMVKKSAITISIHGTKRSGDCIYIGGRDSQIKYALYNRLSDKLNGIDIKLDKVFTGKDISNITNRNMINAGVQLEFTRSLRNKLFKNDIPTPLFHNIVLCVRECLQTFLFEDM